MSDWTKDRDSDETAAATATKTPTGPTVGDLHRAPDNKGVVWTNDTAPANTQFWIEDKGTPNPAYTIPPEAAAQGVTGTAKVAHMYKGAGTDTDPSITYCGITPTSGHQGRVYRNADPTTPLCTVCLDRQPRNLQNNFAAWETRR